MKAFIRIALITIFIFGSLAYSEEVRVPASEQELAVNKCTWIKYDVVTGLVTVRLKDFITDTARVDATINGTDVSDIHQAAVPGKATMGKKIRFPNANPNGFKPNNFIVQISSVLLAQAIAKKQSIVLTIVPGHDMFDTTVRKILYPAEDASCK